MHDTINISFVSENVQSKYGEMSKLKSSLGLRISSAPRSSSYIIQTRLKRAVNGYGAYQETVKQHVKRDRMITKVNSLSDTELMYFDHLLETEGLDEFIRVLELPAYQIRKKSKGFVSSDETPE